MNEHKRSNEEVIDHQEDHQEMKKAKTDEDHHHHKPKLPAGYMKVEPYLYFPGNAREAIDFYVDVFDGKLGFITLYTDAPPSMAIPDEYKEKVMHATVTFKDGDDFETNLMFSDTFPDKTGEHIIGNNVHLSIGMTNLPRMQNIWKKFENHEKTKITQPLQKQFWGSVYGNLIDPYGVHWMFSAPDDEANNNNNNTHHESETKVHEENVHS